jgi:hypothetical protein
MIVQETYEINGRQFVRTFSDEGRYVVGGVPEGEYVEANDPAEIGRIYTEGNLIPDKGGDATEEEVALTRYANELTGGNAENIQEATENLIKLVKED